MPKYGKGLAIEIVNAVKSKEISEPITVEKIRNLCSKRQWNVGENYINVVLANSSSEEHSPTFVKRFSNISEGEYIVRDEYR